MQSYRERLYTLHFESRLKSNQVFDNLRARGREWRESRIPEELRPLGVRNLLVRIEDDAFMMQWSGNVSPIYSPALKGTIEETRSGSDIKAGFGIMPMSAVSVLLLLWLPLDTALHPRSVMHWALLGVMVLVLLYILGRGRGRSDVFKKHLLQVMEEALTTPPQHDRAFAHPVSTNGP